MENVNQKYRFDRRDDEMAASSTSIGWGRDITSFLKQWAIIATLELYFLVLRKSQNEQGVDGRSCQNIIPCHDCVWYTDIYMILCKLYL